MIRVLPVIPENEVVCNCVDDWPQERVFSDGTVSTPHKRIGYDASRFGYVAILRDDTVLLEVGRPFASLQQNVNSMNHYDESKEEINNWNMLDATIYGLLQPAAVPGWRTFRLNIDSDSPQSQWIGLRFHVYDDTVLRVKNDYTIWTFCLVYRCMEQEYAQQYQEWMVRNLIQFTELFRKNDVVWQTGSTLSCQYLFAPVIEQRMQLHNTTSANRHIVTPAPTADDSGSSDDSWTFVAERIIDRNHCILVRTSDDCFIGDNFSTKVVAKPSSQAPGPPFVSDCEDSDSNSSLENNDENGASDYDDESTRASDTYFSPERTDVFPGYYCTEDDENACLERLAASNSVWKSVEQSRNCNDLSLLTNRIVVLSISAKTEKSPLSMSAVPLPVSPANINPEDASNESLDSDEENIPLICLVGNQVDDQHSDLWKRSPKCISKAVALGHSPRRQEPIAILTAPSSPLTKQIPSVKAIETLSSPLDVVVNAFVKTVVKFWECVSNRPDDQRNVMNENIETTTREEGCWCRALFKPKPSAFF